LNLNNFTIKSQEAIQKAFEIAQGFNHQAIEPAHILKGVLEQTENITDYLLRKLGVNPSTFMLSWTECSNRTLRFRVESPI
jgi:ATP-dependent Clp protease ATP-binding subunit ClpB